MNLVIVKRLVGVVVVAGALVTGIAAPADSKPLRMEKVPDSSPTFIFGVPVS